MGVVQTANFHYPQLTPHARLSDQIEQILPLTPIVKHVSAPQNYFGTPKTTWQIDIKWELDYPPRLEIFHLFSRCS